MHQSITFIALLCLLKLGEAAAGCTRDSCFNAVATSNNKNPAQASRRADCSSFLKTVIDDDKTVTVTSYTTTTRLTQTISAIDTTVTEYTLSTVSEVSFSTVVETSTPDPVTVTDDPITITTITEVKRDVVRTIEIDSPRITALPSLEDRDSVLEARDKIIVSGNKPSYATACKNAQAYATACLCWGVKPATQRIAPKTSTRRITIEATTTATVFQPETTVITDYTTEISISVVTSTTIRPAPTLDATQFQKLVTSPGGREIDIGRSINPAGGFMRALFAGSTSEVRFRLAREFAQINSIANGDFPNDSPVQLRREQPQYGVIMIPSDTPAQTEGVLCRFTGSGRLLCRSAESDGSLTSFYICQGNLLYLAVTPWNYGDAFCVLTDLKLKSLSYS